MFILVLVRVIQRAVANRRGYTHKWRCIIGICPNDNRSKPRGWSPRKASGATRPESEGPRARSTNVQGQEKEENWPFFCLFGPFIPSVDWKKPPHLIGRSSLLRVPVQMQISSRRPSQTHSNIMFYPLARHPLAQSG